MAFSATRLPFHGTTRAYWFSPRTGLDKLQHGM